MIIKQLRKVMGARGSFSRDVSVTVSGNVLAQAVPVLLSPVLTRLFTPQEFGIFFLFNALASLLLIFATGRYELAIHLPSSDGVGLALMRLVIVTSVISAAGVLVIVVLLRNDIAVLFGEPSLAGWLWLMPPLLIVGGSYMALYYWGIRKARFNTNASSRVVESLASGGIRASSGLLNSGVGGLILGALAGRVAAIIILWNRFRATLSSPRSKEKVLPLAVSYRAFPLRMTWGSFFNLGANQAPNILLARIFEAGIVGMFGMMDRILRVPLGAISGGFSDVFRQRAAEDIRRNGSCSAVYGKTLFSLALIGLPMLIVLLLWAPGIFSWLFGADWKISGEIARIFAVPIYISFIVNALVPLYYIAGRTATYLGFHFLLFSTVVGSMMLSAFLRLVLTETLYVLSAAYAVPSLAMLIHLTWLASQRDIPCVDHNEEHGA